MTVELKDCKCPQHTPYKCEWQTANESGKCEDCKDGHGELFIPVEHARHIAREFRNQILDAVVVKCNEEINLTVRDASSIAAQVLEMLGDMKNG